MTTHNPIVRFFNWWNQAMVSPANLEPDAFGEHFHANARLIVNGNLRASSLGEMVAHYRAIADRLDLVEMVLPVEEAFATAERAFVHCRTRACTGGTESAEEAMAYAVVEDGRMRLLRVVSLAV